MVPGDPGTAEEPAAKAKVAVLGPRPLSSVRAQRGQRTARVSRLREQQDCLAKQVLFAAFIIDTGAGIKVSC